MNTRYSSLLLSAMAVLALGVLLGGCRSYPSCKNDGHCERYDRGTPFCVDQICRECTDDSACDRGERCTNNQCTAIPGWCEDNADCTAPMICLENRCQPECRSDNDCEMTERCDAGECVEAECRTDDQCAEGFRCEGYACVEIPPPPVPCGDGEFETVYFDFDESALTRAAQNVMDENLACYGIRADDSVLAGHADERGTSEYNLALSGRRARAVRNWLEDNGIERARMRTVSYGENRPVARGSNESAWRQNRRVELSWE